jgi:sugar-specific transcriptional regulator TrmB
MNQSKVIAALKEFGLSEKEAKTFLASLKLGPAVVQDIAKEAGLTRPSVYLMVEAMRKRGLMTVYKRGKKSIYRAGHPNLLKYVNSQDKARLVKKERAVRDLIISIGVVASDSDIDVRIMEAQQAIVMMQDALLATKNTWYEICNLKRSRQTMPLHYDGDKRLAIIKKGNLKAVAKESEGYMLPGTTPTRSARPGRDISSEIITADNTCHFNYLINGDKKMLVTNRNISKTIMTLSEGLHDDSIERK